MAKVVKVTSSDVQRARLLLRVNNTLNRPTPAGIRKIAEAQPAAPGADPLPTPS